MQRVWSEREEKKAGKMAKVGKAERERERESYYYSIRGRKYGLAVVLLHSFLHSVKLLTSKGQESVC